MNTRTVVYSYTAIRPHKNKTLLMRHKWRGIRETLYAQAGSSKRCLGFTHGEGFNDPSTIWAMAAWNSMRDLRSYATGPGMLLSLRVNAASWLDPSRVDFVAWLGLSEIDAPTFDHQDGRRKLAELKREGPSTRLFGWRN